jgi:hypothetical protein
MKRVVAIALFLLMLVGCASVSESEPSSVPEPTPPVEEVTMWIKEGTLNAEGCTVIVRDTYEEPCTFGEAFTLAYKVDGQWQDYPYARDPEEIVFHLLGYEVGPTQQMEIPVQWVWAYGELGPGEYRLIKEYSMPDWQFGQEKSQISVDFIIEAQA